MSTNYHVEITDALAASHTNLNVPLAALDSQLTDMDDGTHNFSAINIDGGAIDGATIGGTTPGAGTFTNIAATGNLYGPAWRVTLGGGTQAISATTSATVQFDTETLDSNSNFNTGTYTLTPTVEGWYFCMVRVTWTAAWNADKSMQVQVQASSALGVATAYLATSGTNIESLMAYGIPYCNGSSDTIHITAYNGDSVSRSIQGNTSDTWFAGWRIQ